MRPPVRFSYDVHGFEEGDGDAYYVRRREDAGLLRGANSNLAMVRRVYEKEGGRGGENPYWRSRKERPLVFAPPPAVP